MEIIGSFILGLDWFKISFTCLYQDVNGVPLDLVDKSEFKHDVYGNGKRQKINSDFTSLSLQ